MHTPHCASAIIQAKKGATWVTQTPYHETKRKFRISGRYGSTDFQYEFNVPLKLRHNSKWRFLYWNLYFSKYEFIRLFSLVINTKLYNGCIALYLPVLSISPFSKLHSSEKQFSHITGDWSEYKVVYNDLCEWCRPGFELCSLFTFGESIWTTSVYYSEFFAALENDSVSVRNPGSKRNQPEWNSDQYCDVLHLTGTLLQAAFTKLSFPITD